MKRTHLPTLIAVDGGGTRCRFVMLDKRGRVETHLSAANASTDLHGTISTLKQGLAALAETAGLPLGALAQVPAYLGLAGVVDQQTGVQIARALPLRQVVVEDDRRSAMAGALGPSDGCVVAIGTGSFFGRRVAGQDRLIGGWGFILGDGASGAALGRQALGCLLDVHDGMRPATPLTQALLAEIGPPPQIIAFAATAKPSDFAALAPSIVTAARAGDAVGLALMQAGAEHISRQIHLLGWQPGERICPIGGLAPHYAPYLPTSLQTHLSAPEGTALDGALALAAQIGTSA